MAAARRGSTAPLIELLSREPHRFDARQAVRVLDAWRRARAASPARFRGTTSMTFPIADIEKVAMPEDAAQPPVMTVSYLGIGGAMGPLPVPYTEHLNAGVRRGETAGRDFVDIFNHRLIESSMALARLFRPALEPGLPQQSGFAAHHYALLGLATPNARDAIPALAPALLPLAPLIHQRPLSAHAIERALSAHLGARTRVRQFRGDWIAVPAAQRTRIGRRGCNRRLGVDSMVGGRVWDAAAGIAIDIGPMPRDAAERYLPGDGAAGPERQLRALLGFLTEGMFEIELRLRVEGATLGPGRLGRGSPMRLGWTSWLRGTAAPRGPRARLGRSARLGRRRIGHPAEDPPPVPIGGAPLPEPVIRLRPTVYRPGR